MFGVFAGLSLMRGLSDSIERGALSGLLLGMATLARTEWALLVIPFGVYAGSVGESSLRRPPDTPFRS